MYFCKHIWQLCQNYRKIVPLFLQKANKAIKSPSPTSLEILSQLILSLHRSRTCPCNEAICFWASSRSCSRSAAWSSRKWQVARSFLSAASICANTKTKLCRQHIKHKVCIIQNYCTHCNTHLLLLPTCKIWIIY